MHYTPLIQSPQDSTSGLTQGRTIPRAVGEAPLAGDALAGARGQQYAGATGRNGAGSYMREYHQRKEVDRRKHSRRIHSGQQPLMEIRSGVERRCGSRRKGEATMHIRVKV